MIPTNEYGQRRANLLAKMKEESILLVFAGEPKKASADEDYPFEVNRNFYYLTGIDQE
ncbi:MAG: aminopeptidase P N-terminal domain-containing protein, partial [Bacilli bacterium]|nr:aminopeptidase P N-terminal domain-containing protein [Bacilli bacterium]